MRMQLLVNGMTPEERGFKRSRSGGNGGGESAEHAAKRARFWEANPQVYFLTLHKVIMRMPLS